MRYRPTRICWNLEVTKKSLQNEAPAVKKKTINMSFINEILIKTWSSVCIYRYFFNSLNEVKFRNLSLEFLLMNVRSEKISCNLYVLFLVTIRGSNINMQEFVTNLPNWISENPV